MTEHYLPPSYERRLRALEERAFRAPLVGGPSLLLDGFGAPILPGGTRIPSGGLVPPDQKPPDPTGLTLTPGAGGGDVWLQASWTPAALNAAGPVVSWLITATEDGETLPLAPWTPLVSQAPPFRLGGLKGDTGYTVVVRAVTATGASSTGLSGHQTTGHDTGPPPTLTGLAGAAYYTGLIVSWTHIGTVQVPFQGHYEAQLATNAGFTTGVQTKNTGLSSVAPFAGLTTGQQVWVRVRAVSSGGVVGAWSTSITLTPGTVDPGDLAAGTLAAGVVYAGVIDAGQITTGTLDAAVIDVIHLNASNITAGAMSVGRLSAGTIGAILIQLASGGLIESANYVAGVSGWAMDGAGNLEANNAIFRGVLAAVQIAGDDLTIYGQSGRVSARLFTELVTGTPRAWLQLGDGYLVGAGINWFQDYYHWALANPGGGRPGLEITGGDVLIAGLLRAAGSIMVGGNPWSGGVYPRDGSGDPDFNWGFEIASDVGLGHYYTYLKAWLDGSGDRRIGWLNAFNGRWLAFANTNGDLNAYGTWFDTSPSSELLKTSITRLDPSTVRERLASLGDQGGLVQFRYKQGKGPQRDQPFTGYIREVFEPLFPELVSASGEDWGIDKVSMIPLIIADLNGLAARLDALEAAKG